jgi:glycerol-3-phosphate acyltransferase PlsX
MPRIAVDAMGSDAAPRVELEGVLAAVRARGVQVTLVGDEARLRAELAALGADENALKKGAIVIRHAPDVITMHDAPSMAVKQKKQSSMRVCFDLVKSGEADAVVSAGNSGAMMACGLFVLGRLPGVERPAIVTTFPPRRASARCSTWAPTSIRSRACWRSSRCSDRSTRACCTGRGSPGWDCCRTGPRTTRGRR